MSPRELDEHNITEAVIERFAKAPDERVKSICTSLVKHLHDFVRDVRPSEEEWGYAIDFLTRTGQMCDGNRQEFVLLSDTLGVSTLVDVDQLSSAARRHEVDGARSVLDGGNAGPQTG